MDSSGRTGPPQQHPEPTPHPHPAPDAGTATPPRPGAAQAVPAVPVTGPTSDLTTGLADLARACRHGDDDAASATARDAFLTAVRPHLLRWARPLVDDPALAEDVAQDALIEIDRTLTALREPAAVTAWLRLAVRKHADRRHRSRARTEHPTGSTPTTRHVLDLDLGDLGDLGRTRLPPRAPDLDAPDSLAADPALAAERAQDRTMIRRALARSPDADRLLLVLRYYGDWGEAELAAFLGITGGAVRKRLHDARRRLRARLTTTPPTTDPPGNPDESDESGNPATDPWETLMTDARALLGTDHHLDDLPSTLPPGRPPLTRPTAPDRLPTGFKVLDTLVPLPRGGTADLTGPVGTGHLALLAEILHNLTTAGTAPAALVAVSPTHRPPRTVSARLWKLTQAPAPAADRTTVVHAPPGREADALDAAARIAGWLAHDGATVLLALDQVVANALGPDQCATAVGVCATGPGSVTALRIAPTAVDAPPAPPWPGADTEIRLGTGELVADLLPPVDVTASRSALLDGDTLPAPERETAHRARTLLADAARLRTFLTQPLHLLQDATGTPAGPVPVPDATTGLAHLLG